MRDNRIHHLETQLALMMQKQHAPAQPRTVLADNEQMQVMQQVKELTQEEHEKQSASQNQAAKQQQASTSQNQAAKQQQASTSQNQASKQQQASTSQNQAAKQQQASTSQNQAAKQQQASTSQNQAAKQPKPESASNVIDEAKYDADPRVRTGAYRIVGVDRVVKVQAGQTLSSISRTWLGPGMECYVEALNGSKEVKVGQEVKIPKLKIKRK